MDAEPSLEDSIEIAAPPARVWELVGDVTRMPEWSPQVSSTRLRSGFDAVRLGAQLTHRNHQFDLDWTTHGEIVRLVPGREIAFRIEENWVVWSFTLEPTADGGTRLTERRETPNGISDLSRELTEGFLGGMDVFRDSLREGIRQTLAALKTAAEHVEMGPPTR